MSQTLSVLVFVCFVELLLLNRAPRDRNGEFLSFLPRFGHGDLPCVTVRALDRLEFVPNSLTCSWLGLKP